MTNTLSVDDLLHGGAYEKEAPLRIYLGAAPGVGKTYRMLRDGNNLKAQGVDVVIGYVEPHKRVETTAQIGNLEVIPPKSIRYKGVDLLEMDTSAVIARKPAVALVDELAHTNAEGSQHQKRYQDIEDLLAAGIAVFSTCNIQHLESVHDTVELMTGVHVQERVPDTFFNLAKEIIIVDVTPEELQERLRQGKIYPAEKIQQSLAHFFSRGNISLLRELALRELANDVEQKGKEQRQKVSKAGVVSIEKVLVAIKARDDAKKLIRAGSRLAGRINAKWIVTYVELPSSTLTPEAETLLHQNFHLARSLGATVIQLRGENVAKALLDFAKAEGVTQIVIGATQRAWWKRMLAPSVVASVLKEVGETAVHVYPLKDEGSQVLATSEVSRKPAAVKLTDYLSPERILVHVEGLSTVEQTISILIDHLIQCSPDLAGHRQAISEMIMQRERLMSTFLETGIAIPHAAGCEEITDIHAVMALVPSGVMSIGREEKAYIVLLFLSPQVGHANHLKFLAAIARVFVDATTTREIATSTSSTEAFDAIALLENTGRVSDAV